jgi:S-adenosyl-L-methionine hydrolase (adenosine-forming)
VILLFTDFGLEGPYTGQVKAVLAREAPGVPAIDLFADLPAFDAQSAAYLLVAHAGESAAGTIHLCVVDPGVGSDRAALILRADGRWFVGPDNGLLEIVARRGVDCAWWEIDWRPARLSASFHGRDLFAPVVARLARGEAVPGRPIAPPARAADWPEDLPRIVYIDRYGNAMSGMRATALPPAAELKVAGQRLPPARTFADVPRGTGMWYENANGLAEIAVNQGRADRDLGLRVGDAVSVLGIDAG